jgi:amino acid permease
MQPPKSEVTPFVTTNSPLMNESLIGSDPFHGEGSYSRAAASSPSNGADHAVVNSMDYLEDSPDPHRKDPPSNACSAFLQRVVPHGGSLSGMVNLASCTLGASIISLPYAFFSSGIFVACIALVLITAATVFAIHLLVDAGERTQMRSYEEMARSLIGRRSEYVVAFLMWFFCFGTCVAYVIALGDAIIPFLKGQGSGFWHDDWGVHVVTIIIWACVMLPLSLPKEINSLRYFSLVAVSLIGFFVVVMVYHTARYGFTEDHLDQLQSFRGGAKAIDGLALFMFAFMCQINCFEVYFEMHPRSVKKMTNDVSISMSVCCILYIVAGFFGYFDFVDQTQDAILKNYNPRSDVLVAISFIGIAFKLCVGFSLCIQPARDAIFYVFNMGEYHLVSTRTRVLICAGMSVCALVLGLLIPKINIVFGFLGSLIGGLVGFALPAWFSMKSTDNWGKETVGTAKYFATWALLVGGLVSFVVGTVASIIDISGVA